MIDPILTDEISERGIAKRSRAALDERPAKELTQIFVAPQPAPMEKLGERSAEEGRALEAVFGLSKGTPHQRVDGAIGLRVDLGGAFISIRRGAPCEERIEDRAEPEDITRARRHRAALHLGGEVCM